MTISSHDIIKIVEDLFNENHSNRGAKIPVTGATRLIADLGFSSVEFVVIFEKVQQLLPERLNFIDLIMPDRCSYVDDLSINDILDFLAPGGPDNKQDSTPDPYADKREPITQSDIVLLNQVIRHQEYNEEQVELKTQLCFLLSAPRSGSTLLRRMLGCHPEIYAPMELHLMAYQDYAQRNQELNGEQHAHLLEGTIVARQETRKMTRSVSIAVDQMYVRDRRPVTQFFKELDPYIEARVLVDKTPSYAFSLSILERIKRTFPDAKFIHLTRLPNAVIKSMIDSDLGQLIRFMQTSGIKKERFAEALWCLCERNINTALADIGPNAIRIDYESLVNSPEEKMNELHDFLGVPRSLSINPYAQEIGRSAEQVMGFAGDLKNYLRKSIDPSVADEWQLFDSLHWLSEPTAEILRNR